MKHPISSSLALILATSLLSTSCGRSKDDRETSHQSSNPLVPSDFQNTTSPEGFQEKNQKAQLLLQDIKQQLGIKMQDSKANESALVLTQTALQAFIGAKADSALLSRSLELEASLSLITRLLADGQPNSCTAVLASVEAIHTSLTLAATEAVSLTRYDQLQKTAQRLGLDVEQKPASPDAALAFHLKGSQQWAGLSLNQELDISAGADDRYVFVKRDSKLSSTLSRPGEPENPGADIGHYSYTATGGLSADLLQKSLVIMDKREAELDMTRNGASILGSSKLDLQSRMQGGELPSMTTELNLDLKGQGLVDEDGYSLFNEQRRFTSELTRVDANTLRLKLALDSQGVKGTRNLKAEWLLHRNAEGDCSVIRPGQ